MPTAVSQAANTFSTGFTNAPALPEAGGPDIPGRFADGHYANYWQMISTLREPNKGVYRIDVYYGDVNGSNASCTTGAWGTATCPGTSWGSAPGEYDQAKTRTNQVVITLRQGRPGAQSQWPTAHSFALFAAAAVAEFPLAQVFEIGNEVNRPGGSTPPLIGPGNYQVLVSQVFAAIPSPRKVLVGSLDGALGTDDPIPYVSALDKNWYKLLSTADKARVALSVHPYLQSSSQCIAPGPGSAGARFPSIDRLRSFLTTIATPSTVVTSGETLGSDGIWTGDVWITEFDWRHGLSNEAWDDGTSCPHETVAGYINQLFTYLNGTPRVKALIWYRLVDQRDWPGGLVPPVAPVIGHLYTCTDPKEPSAPRNYCDSGDGVFDLGWGPGDVAPSTANNPYWAWSSNIGVALPSGPPRITLLQGAVNGSTNPDTPLQFAVSFHPLTTWSCTIDGHPMSCPSPSNLTVTGLGYSGHTFGMTVQNVHGSAHYDATWTNGQLAPSATIASSDIANGATQPDFHISFNIANAPLTTWSCSIDGHPLSCPNPYSVTIPGLAYSGHDFNIHLQNFGGSFDLSPHITWMGGQPPPVLTFTGSNVVNGSHLSSFHLTFSVANQPLTSWVCYMDGVQFTTGCSSPFSIDTPPLTYGSHEFVLFVYNFGGSDAFDATWVGGA